MSNPDILFSVIVPAYNCERYIAKCLDSLCNQDYSAKNYELVIINDGSTDRTGEICDSYAAKFDFIHVFHTKNQGPSAARNFVLTHCKGKYIAFCDSDDLVSTQLISILTHAIELDSDSDMFVFKYCLDINDLKVYDCQRDYMRERLHSEEFCIRFLTDMKVGGYSWNKVIKADILDGILYNKNLQVCEDMYFLTELCAQHPNMKICMLDCCLYCYVQHEDAGLSRIPGRIYDKNGLSLFVTAYNDALQIANLSPRVSKQIEGLIYYWCTGNLYQMGRLMTPATRAQIKIFMRKYASKYYLRSKHSISLKIRALFRHVLALFHVYKYK